jgi:hypothetical protein
MESVELVGFYLKPFLILFEAPAERIGRAREIYLELLSVLLASVPERIVTGFTKFSLSLYRHKGLIRDCLVKD